MNDTAIAAELERLREPATQWFAHEARQQQLGIWLGAVKPDFAEVTAPLKDALTAHAVFGPGRNCFFGMKQLVLHPHFLPRNLLHVALKRGTPSALEWLHQIYTVEKADLRVVAEMYGLTISEPIKLRNGVTIVLLNDVPNSTNARSLLTQFQVRPGQMLTAGLMFPPNAAMLEIPGAQVSASYEAGKPDADRALDEIVRSVKAFTLADHAAPVVGISWTDFVDPDLAAAEVGQMWMGARFEGNLNRVPAFTVDDAALAWVDRYLQLQPDVRPLCDVAIDRLNLARRRASPGDKAIDGAICLEALLGDEDHQELTYRLKLRAALLLETELAERKRVRDTVGAFYSLRSAIVHGRVRKKRDEAKDAACATAGLDICARVLRTIVLHNRKPVPGDWELSGGSTITQIT